MITNRRTKGKKQKHRFPIKDFGNDGGGRSSPLNGSKLFKGKKPLDSHLLVTPAIFKPFLACP